MMEHSISDQGLAARWRSIDWAAVDSRIMEMQREISIASRDGDSDRLAGLTDGFLASFEVRARAVAEVTSKDASRHPGMGERWETDADRMRAVSVLDHRGYRSEPFVSFVRCDDRTGKRRTMVVPTFYDRAVHQMLLMLLEPVCEPLYDLRLFSARRGRSVADAACEVRRLFTGADAPEWVVRCDVRSYYDTLPHEVILDSVPLDRGLLEQIVRAPRIPNGTGEARVPDMGCSTGNRLSPVIGNMALNGLEDALRGDDPDSGIAVRWVDDIVVTAVSEEDALRTMARVRGFLHRRGLRLNEDKSYVASVRDGFEFLKYRMVRHGDGIRMTPTDDAVADLLDSVRSAVSAETDPDRVVSSAGNRLRGFTTKYRFADLEGCADAVDSGLRGIVDERLVALGRTSSKRLRSVSDTVPIAWTPLLLRANWFIDREYFDSKASRDREERVASDRYRAIWASTGGCCALCGLRIRRDDRRAVAESEGVRAYVHRACMDECGALGIAPRFLDLAPRRNIEEPAPSEDGCPQDEELDRSEDAPDGIPLAPPPAPRPCDRSQGASPGRTVLRTKRGTVSKYQGLLDLVLACNYPWLDLSFKAVSDAVGGLCSYAYRSRAWWFRRSRSTIGEALAAIGWEVESVDMEREMVRLRPAEAKRTPAEESYLSRRGADAEAAIAERDLRIGSRFGKLTAFLLESDMDQIRLSFDAVSSISGVRLPDRALRDAAYWSSRRAGGPLLAIEDGDFSRVALDVGQGWVLVTRTCCVPEPERGDVPKGGLRMKNNLRAGWIVIMHPGGIQDHERSRRREKRGFRLGLMNRTSSEAIVRITWRQPCSR